MADDAEDQTLDTETQDTTPPEEAPLPEVPQEETPEAPKYGVVPIDSSRLTPGGVDRRQFVDELTRNPGLINRLTSVVHGEVGANASTDAKIIQAETAFNRAQSRGHSLEQALWDKTRYGSRGYYPAASYVPVSPTDVEAFRQTVLDAIMHGSDLARGATGNASGSTALAQVRAGMPHFQMILPDGSVETYFNEERRSVNLPRLGEDYISPRIPEGRGQEQRFRPIEAVTPENIPDVPDRISPPIPEGRGQEQRFRPASAPVEVTPENIDSIPDPYAGVSQTPRNDLTGAVEPYAYLTSRGHNLVGLGLNPVFADRLSRAIQRAESVTGQQAVIRDLYRSPETQAQYRANYIKRPVAWGGKIYYPNGPGGLAAPPGRSGHQSGLSADIQRGPVLDYLHRHAREFGLSFLGGNAFARDPGHIRLAGSLGANIGNARYAPVGRVSPAPLSGPGTGKSAAISDDVGDELANLAAPVAAPVSTPRRGAIAASPELDTEAPPPPGVGLTPTVTAGPSGRTPLKITVSKELPPIDVTSEPPNVAIPETPAPEAPAAQSEAELLDALLEAAQPSKPRGTPAQQYAPGMTQTSPIEPLVEELSALLDKEKGNKAEAEPVIQRPMPDLPVVPAFGEVPPEYFLLHPEAQNIQHQVIGANGMPQTVTAADVAMSGPMVGANKGFALSPEALAREPIPFPAPTEEQRAMTHGPGDTRPTLPEIYEQSGWGGRQMMKVAGAPLMALHIPVNIAKGMHEYFGEQLSKPPGQLEPITPEESGQNMLMVLGATGVGAFGGGVAGGINRGTVLGAGPIKRTPPKPQTVADLIKAVETREAQAAAPVAAPPAKPQTVADLIRAVEAREAQPVVPQPAPQSAPTALAPPVRKPQPAPTPQVAPAAAPPVASPGGARGGGAPPPSLTQTPPPAAPPPPTPPVAAPPASVPPTGRRGWLPAGPALVPGVPYRPSIIDFGRMADDANAGLRRFMGRAGVPASEVERMHMLHNSATGAAGQTFATNAALNGEAHMMGASYKAPRSFSDLEIEARAHPDFEPYMYARDTLDDVRKLMRAKNASSNPQAGAIRVRGMTEADAQQAIMRYEQQDPVLRQLANDYYAHVQETRQFQHDMGTLTTRELHNLNTHNPNEVLWSPRVAGTGRIMEAGRADANTARVRGDIFQNAKDMTSATIRETLGEMVAREGADLLKATPNGGYMLRPVALEHFTNNPDAKFNRVTFKRNGVPEHYVAENRNVADWLDHGAPTSGNTFSRIWHSIMNTYRVGTTGVLNWPFAFLTDPVRNTMIAKTTIGQYGRSPGLAGKAQAAFGLNPLDLKAPGWIFAPGSNIPFGPGTWAHSIPAQVIPQIAEHIANSILKTNNGWFARTYGPQAVRSTAEAMARAMLNWKANTTYGKAMTEGGFSGSRLTRAESAYEAQQGIFEWLRDKAMQTPTGRRAAPVLNALLDNMLSRTVLGLAHGIAHGLPEASRNGTNFAAIRANMDRVPFDKLVAWSRELTGNPQTSGRFTRTGSARPITFDPGEAAPGVLGAAQHVTRQLARPATFLYGAANEAGRAAVPYYNMTQQGWKNRLSNPASFLNPLSYINYAPPVIKMAVAGYLYNRFMGNDPNGVSYVDHSIYGQSPNRASGTIYFAKPGAPATEGFNVPIPQEDVLIKDLVWSALHHVFGDAKDIRTSFSEDFGHALASYLDIAMMPPMNPAAAGLMESFGVSAPQNFGALLKLIPAFKHANIGGEVFNRKEPMYAYDENAVLPSKIQHTLYALNPGFESAVNAALGAYYHTPPQESTTANVAKAVARQQAGTGLLSQILGLPNYEAGSTRETEKMFERKKVINEFLDYYNKYGLTGERLIAHSKPVSREGQAKARAYGMEELPPEIAGLSQSPPKNELYMQLANDFANRVRKDKLEGLKTAQRLWTDATQHIQVMRSIDPGNDSTWRQQLAQRPTMVRYLQQNGVDINDRVAVRNALERYRQNTAKYYNYIIDKIERDYSQKMGQPIKIEDLNPREPWYSKLNTTP